MIVFIVSGVVLVCFALILLLPSLWGTESSEVMDQHRINVGIAREELAALSSLHENGQLTKEEFIQRRKELELTLASSLNGVPETEAAGSSGSASVPVSGRGSSAGRWMTALVALFVPLSAIYIYLQIGHPDALNPDYVAAQSPMHAQGDVPTVEELLPRLEAHLRDNPDDVTGLSMLGVTYLRMQRFADADGVLSRALELDDKNVDLMLQLADAKAMVARGQLGGAPEDLVARALALRPDDIRAIWLSGMAKQQSGDFAAAISFWETLVPRLDSEPQALAEVKQLIGEAKAEMSGEAVSGTPAADNNTPATTSVSVSVSLDQAFTAQVKPDQVLYVYAKAVEGPPMPLAVARLTASELPLTVVLDDSMAMMPQMKLSGFEQVAIGARISQSGDPIAQTGDLFGEVKPVTVSDKTPVSIRISRTVP